MSVEGFDLALKNAITFTVTDGETHHSLLVLTIPSLVYLKLVAWLERAGQPTRRKHIEDIFIIIENYPTLNPDAIEYTLPDGVSDSLSRNACFLGRDMGSLGNDQIFATLSSLLEREETSGGKRRMLQDLRNFTRGNFTQADHIIKWLREGLAESQSSI